MSEALIHTLLQEDFPMLREMDFQNDGGDTRRYEAMSAISRPHTPTFYSFPSTLISDSSQLTK